MALVLGLALGNALAFDASTAGARDAVATDAGTVADWVGALSELLAVTVGSEGVGREATGAAARYLSQSALVPPAFSYVCRANVARLSPAGVPRVRFTDRARYRKPSA